MWNPTCYGDPGKVSDAEYKCDRPSDAGGVHSNSGVPNHAYALLVDGGTFNGQTVTGIGLDKAAAIYWRAQTAYLTPHVGLRRPRRRARAVLRRPGRPADQQAHRSRPTPTPVRGHADHRCRLRPGPGRRGRDRAAHRARRSATSSRCSPRTPPPPAARASPRHVLSSEDFEDGLGRLDHRATGRLPGRHREPVATVTRLRPAPGDHAGGVAVRPGPAEGQCVNGPGDFSSRDSIISPAITVPDGLAVGRAHLRALRRDRVG